MMLEKNFTPAADGFHMPGEYEPHDGCIIVWPQRPGSWSSKVATSMWHTARARLASLEMTVGSSTNCRSTPAPPSDAS